MDANTLDLASKHHSSSSGHSTVLSSVQHSTGFTFAAPTPVNTLNLGTDTPLFKEPPPPANPALVLKPPSSWVVENVSFAEAAKSLLRVNLPTQKPATQESPAQKSPIPKPAAQKSAIPKPPPSPKPQRTAHKPSRIPSCSASQPSARTLTRNRTSNQPKPTPDDDTRSITSTSSKCNASTSLNDDDDDDDDDDDGFSPFVRKKTRPIKPSSGRRNRSK